LLYQLSYLGGEALSVWLENSNRVGRNIDARAIDGLGNRCAHRRAADVRHAD